VNVRRAALALGALLSCAGCTTTVTTVRTVSTAEYAAHSWIGRGEQDVVNAWGENGRQESDGSGGRLWTYGRMSSHEIPPGRTSGDSGRHDFPAGPNDDLPQRAATVDELAKFWIDADGKVYRFWFAAEIYKKGLDAPTAKPVEVYGKKSP